MIVLRYLASLGLAVITLMIAAVSYQTLWDHGDPIIVDAQNIKVTRDINGVTLIWNCRSSVLRDVKGHVVRYLLREDNGEMISLPSSEFNFKSGVDFPIIRRFALPSTLSAGRWCLQSIMHWYEPLALRESTMQGLSVCFDVPPIPVMTDSDLLHKIDELERYVMDHAKADFNQHAELLTKGPK